MVRFKIVLITIIFFTVINSANSQQSSYPVFNWDDEPKWDDLTHWRFHDFRPFIEGSYGSGIPRHKLFKGDFERYGALEIRLGYSHIVNYQDFVLEMDEHYLFGNFSNQKQDWFDSETEVEKVRTEITRFGFGNRTGFGYKLAFLSILPYHQNHLSLCKLTSERPLNLMPKDVEILERYEGSLRFGVSTEGGLKVEIFRSLSIIGGYETAIVYPRLVFFRWLGGLIIESAIIEGISRFAKDIVDHSSILGPLFYAVLRNGAAYGVYIGTRDKMYWPFNSETPLSQETFKVALAITF